MVKMKTNNLKSYNKTARMIGVCEQDDGWKNRRLRANDITRYSYII